MKVIFKFSQNQERKRILDLYEVLASGWYQKIGYKPIVPPFSQEIHRQLMSENNQNSRQEIINDNFTKIFEKGGYDKCLVRASESWRKTETDFFANLKKLAVTILPQYECFISLYEMQGSYELPNKLTIRCANKDDLSEVNQTIAHEILHLVFEAKIKTEKLSHLEKEGFIDYLMTAHFKKLFLKYKEQKLDINKNISLYRKMLNTKLGREDY